MSCTDNHCVQRTKATDLDQDLTQKNNFYCNETCAVALQVQKCLASSWQVALVSFAQVCSFFPFLRPPFSQRHFVTNVGKYLKGFLSNKRVRYDLLTKLARQRLNAVVLKGCRRRTHIHTQMCVLTFPEDQSFPHKAQGFDRSRGLNPNDCIINWV